ncbi:MAG: hypothetical protein QMD14_03160 [Candidatus Aenigmarchaeota archaeon]|nr:hypothetical protein [Candidatus Aenigmarchaeota archaeon]
MVVLGVVAIILSIYDVFAGVSLLGTLRDFLFTIFLLSTLKGVCSMLTTPWFGAFMGMIDLATGVTSLLLFFGKDIGFFWIVGALVLLKGLYCLFLLSYSR